MLLNLNLDKLMVSIARAQKRPPAFNRLKHQLRINHGKAIGLPRRYPSQWLENRIRDRWERKSRALIEAGGCPF